MTTGTTAKRYGAYHRVSDANGRDLEAETTMTDKVAFEQMDAWAKSRGVQIAERYLDWDQTGAKMERPELARMLADLDAGILDGIVVAQVDRLSRAEVGDALTVVKQIAGDDEQRPRPLVLLDLGIDPSTEFGEFGLTILLALARMQWRRYKRQWSTAQKRAVKRGVWIGPAPVGYRKTEHGSLGFDPATWRIVREAFRIAAGDGMHAAMAYLERELPAKRWRKSDVRRVLSNRAYLGEHHADGGAHDAITTLDVFEAAQTEPQQRRSNGAYPLSGIATCECGAPMVGALQSVNGRSYRRMRCSDTANCGKASISADKLETYVRAELAEGLGNHDFRLRFGIVGIDEAREALELAESERKRYAKDVRARAILGDDAWYAGGEAHTAAVNEAREHYQALAEQNARSADLPDADQLHDPEQFLRGVRGVVGSITVQPGRGHVSDRVRILDTAGNDLNDRAGMLAA